MSSSTELFSLLQIIQADGVTHIHQVKHVCKLWADMSIITHTTEEAKYVSKGYSYFLSPFG